MFMLQDHLLKKKSEDCYCGEIKWYTLSFDSETMGISCNSYGITGIPDIWQSSYDGKLQHRYQDSWS